MKRILFIGMTLLLLLFVVACQPTEQEDSSTLAENNTAKPVDVEKEQERIDLRRVRNRYAPYA